MVVRVWPCHPHHSGIRRKCFCLSGAKCMVQFVRRMRTLMRLGRARILPRKKARSSKTVLRSASCEECLPLRPSPYSWRPSMTSTKVCWRTDSRLVLITFSLCTRGDRSKLIRCAFCVVCLHKLFRKVRPSTQVLTIFVLFCFVLFQIYWIVICSFQ